MLENKRGVKSGSRHSDRYRVLRLCKAEYFVFMYSKKTKHIFCQKIALRNYV